MDMHTGERLVISPSSISAADLRIRIQSSLGSSYALGERIGAGGFAEVFKARDNRLKRDVAIKVLRPEIGLTPGMLDRFRREAETVAALRHPHIVPIYDIGDGEGVAYLIMPFIAGKSLREEMQAGGSKALPIAEAVRILREAAEGLAVAHDAGVIHRDIKPENIMLEGPERRVLLMDFGIAKAVGGDEETPVTEEGVAPALTSTGIIVGTPQYMSPEQACGDKSIDARTDQYSLAVVGYRLLSGTLPFEGESTRAVLYKQLVVDPDPLSEKVSDLPEGLAEVIARAMQKEPRDRFENMRVFATSLSAAIDTVAVKPGVPAPLTKRPKGKKANAKASASPPTAQPLAAAAAPTNAPKPAMPPKPVKPSIALPSMASLGALLAKLPLGRIPPARRALVAGGASVLLVALLVAIVAKTVISSGPDLGEGFTPLSAVGFDDLDSSAAAAGAVIGQPPPPARTVVTPPSAPAATGRTRATPRTTPPPAARTPAPAAAAPKTATCGELFARSEWNAALAACTAAAESERDAVAMRTLGKMYAAGSGVPANPATAFSWFRQAAPNDGEAAFLLSRMYERGDGTKQDLKANIATLRDAARQGYLQAVLTLAQRLEDGAGMDRNEEEAIIWYTGAANRGNVIAMTRLAEMARRGRGMEKNETTAIDWFRKAGEAGSATAALEAAKAYLEGKGVPADEATGMRLLRRAAQLGSADATEELAKRGG
jgi:serine/threonine-protein kinase